MRGEIMFWCMYAGYILLSAILLWLFNRNHKQTVFIKLLIVACIPLIGWLLPIVWNKKPLHQSEQKFSEYVENQQQEHKVRRIGVFNRVEKQRELNIVPIEDALVVSQHKERRQALI